MKYIIALLLAFILPNCAFAVELTNLARNPTAEVLRKQDIFLKAVEKALSIIKPKGAVEVEVIIRNDNDLSHPVQTFLAPKFGGGPVKYMIQVNLSYLDRDPIAYEHAAFHEVIHIKNGDPGKSIDDEAELERHTEYEVFKAVGRERYIQYWEYLYSIDTKSQKTLAKSAFIDSALRYIGVQEGLPPTNLLGN